MDRYDAIIVGARVAGAATALLLARAGHRVLLVDRAPRGSDTLSTHALLRPAVLQLERWGLLEHVIAVGTPPVDTIVFHYGDRSVHIDASMRLYAPRRTVLDPILVDAAQRAGAETRFGVEALDVLRDADGQVTGVRARDHDGTPIDLRSRVVVGADGRRSRIARAVGAPVTHRGREASAFVYGYFSGVETAGYEWCYRPGTTAGVIPTNSGEVCVFVGVPPRRFADEVRHDLAAAVPRVLAETTPAVAERVAAGRLRGPVRGHPGPRGWLRRPWGPGWALVGDAGYYKDPITAHGISDALRDAAFLARALHEVLGCGAPAVSALAAYERVRNELSLPWFEITDAIAGFGWSLEEVQHCHLAMSTVMAREVEVLAGLDGPWATVAA